MIQEVRRGSDGRSVQVGEVAVHRRCAWAEGWIQGELSKTERPQENAMTARVGEQRPQSRRALGMPRRCDSDYRGEFRKGRVKWDRGYAKVIFNEDALT